VKPSRDRIKYGVQGILSSPELVSLSFLLSVLSDFLCMVCSLYPLFNYIVYLSCIFFFIVLILHLNVVVNIAHLVCLCLYIFFVAGPSVFIVQFFCREL